MVAAGINYVLASSQVSGSIGGEFTHEDFFVARASYTLGADLDSINLGIGLKTNLDGMTGEVGYNFSMLGDLGSAHRISVGVKLGDDSGNSRKRPKKSANQGVKPPQTNTKSTLKYYFKKK